MSLPGDRDTAAEEASAHASVSIDAGDAGAARRFPVVYDPPAETRRMALVFLSCFVFSVVGLVLAARASAQPGAQRQRDKLLAAAIALSGGLVSIGVLSRRYRPNGAHARGISLELTDDDVRLWGRGYGTRVYFREVARVRYELVDTYLGRLGALRQLRLTVEGGGKQVEVASEALAEDRGRSPELDLGVDGGGATNASAGAGRLEPQGGEGDCVVLDRSDFDAFERVLIGRLRRAGRLQGLP